MSIFGPIVDADVLEGKVRDTLKQWFPVYLRELEDQLGMSHGTLPVPRGYLVAEDVDKEPEDQLPAIVIVSPGLADTPVQEGDGSYNAPFAVGIGIFASGYDRPTTERLVRRYCAVIRAIMVQKQSLGGFADGTVWMDESYDEITFDAERTLGAGQVIFVVHVANVVNRRGGPAAPTAPDPEEQPGSNWPTVDTVVITEELQEEVA